MNSLIIIDDEKKVIETLSKLLHDNFHDLTISATANSVQNGLEVIELHKPDVVLLDINLPDGTGFDLLRKFGTPSFKVIFITGHEQYAIEAFKFSAIDYILKPIDEKLFVSAIEKAKRAKFLEEDLLKLRALLSNTEKGNELKKIVLRTAECHHFVNTDDIIRCEADNNYTFVHIIGEKRILVSKTIKEYAQLLKQSGFIRVHQSHLINPAHIDRFVKADGGAMIMSDSSSVPVSKDRKAFVLKQLESL